MDQQTLKIIVALLFAGLVLAVGARSAALRRQGVPVFAFAGPKNWLQKLLVGGAALYAPFLILRPLVPELDRATWTTPSPAPAIAIATLLIGVATILIAQSGMGRSWRVGVPSAGGDIDALVTGGLYRFSRNPTYLGIMSVLIGVGLAAPGPLTIGVASTGFACFNAIIADEETYLRSRFGDAYDKYRRRVRRWI